ncbi:MAG: hypothetical protein ABIL09_14800 [Gemmatimonadota bacterium]
MLNLLLRVEILASLVVAGSAAMAVSVVFRFIRNRDALDGKLKKADRLLQKLRKEIASKEGRIKELQEAVALLKPQEAHLRAYHEQLLELKVEQERKATKEGEKKGGGEDEEDGWDVRRKRTRVDR